MSHYLPYSLKRLQHDITSNLHLSSNNSHTNSSDPSSRFPNDEAIRETIQNFTISTNNNKNSFRSFNPGPKCARRGGFSGRPRGRYWNSYLTLPKRAINYDLAESFMDHSTNPLSSELYKIKFKHSNKQWINGRFLGYKEKLDKSDGNPVDIYCSKTFPIVPKKKKRIEIEENGSITSLSTLSKPIVQGEKKKQVDKQINVYTNLFGGGRIPRLPSTTAQTKKPTSTIILPVSNPISLLDRNPTTNHQS